MPNVNVTVSEKMLALRQNSYFDSLSEKLMIDLSLGTQLRVYERGEVLFWEGDPCAGLYIIQRGSIKLFKTSNQGRELIIKVLDEGATFSEVPIFDNGLNPVNAAALEEAFVWLVDADVIRQAMREHPEMCQAVVSNLARNLRMMLVARIRAQQRYSR